jgi:hypothetical protein
LPFAVIDDDAEMLIQNPRNPPYIVFLSAGAVGRCNGSYQTKKCGSSQKQANFLASLSSTTNPETSRSLQGGLV